VRHAAGAAVTLVGTMETMHAAGRRNLPPVPRTSTGRTAPAADRPEPDAESPTERFVVDLATGEQRTVSVAAVDDPKAGVSGSAVSESDASEDDVSADDVSADEALGDDTVQGQPTDVPAADGPPADDTAQVDVVEDDAPEHDAPEHDAPEHDAAQDDVAKDDVAQDDAAGDVPADGGSPLVAGPPADGAPAADLADLDPGQQFVARLRAAAAEFAEAAGAESAVVREAVPPARHRQARCRLVLRYADDSEVDVTFLGSAGRPGTPSRHGFDRQIRRWLNAGQRREDAWLVPDQDASDGLAVDLSAWVAAA
jgi:hypothetical protein